MSPVVPVLKAAGFEPSALMVQIREVPERVLEKTTVAPSGLNDGS